MEMQQVKGTKLTLKEIDYITRELAKEIYGVEFNLPIMISKRMTSTYGYFQYKIVNKKLIPIKIQYSNYLINGGFRLDTIKSIIKHELAHWYLAITGKDFSDGDPTFERELKRINAAPTRTIKLSGEMHIAVCSTCKSIRHRNYSETKARNYGKRRTSGCCKAEIIYGGTIYVEDKSELRSNVVIENKKETQPIKQIVKNSTTLSIEELIVPGPKGVTNVQVNPVIRKAIEENSPQMIQLLIKHYPEIYYSAKKYFGKKIKTQLDNLEVNQ